MNRLCLVTSMVVAMTTANAFAQTTSHDSAHTLVTPAAPAPGRSGQVVQLPQGGVGVTTGGTGNYQTLATPGGNAIMQPGVGGTSTVTGSGGRTGTVNTPR